jgi:hypothetical protein
MNSSVKKFLIGGILFWISILGGHANGHCSSEDKVAGVSSSRVEDELLKKWHHIYEAIAEIESRRTPGVISRSGKYVGYLQISPILVKEVNRILGKEVYSGKDRLNKEKSIEMFVIFQEHHNQGGSFEKACRLWCSGDIHCMKNKTTFATSYFNRVLRKYHEMAANR